MDIRFRRIGGLVGAGVLAGSFVMAGCASNHLASFRSNPSPRQDTLGQNRDEIDNRLTIMSDTNLRMFNSDLGRFLMTDRPSRLTPQNIPY